MIAVNVAELKNDTEKYLDAVARGETVEVRREGKPVAVLSPAPASRREYWRSVKPLDIPGVSLSQAIIEEREEGL